MGRSSRSNQRGRRASWSRDEGGEGGVKAIKGGGRSETYSERGREAMMVVAAG